MREEGQNDGSSLAAAGSSPGPHQDRAPVSSDPDLSSGERKSPPIQTMGKSDDPDPERIPSSIFQRTNTTTPMEWSAASNESLFSIHMGNSSFSRDQAFLLGRSQELGSYYPGSPWDGPSPPPPHPHPHPHPHPISPGPVTPRSAPATPRPPRSGHGLAGAAEAAAPNALVKPGAAEAANADAMNDVLRANDDKDRASSAECGPRSTSASRISDGSVCSFAFPILTGEGREGSIKVVPEHQPLQTEQQQQPPPPAETPKAAPSVAENRWASCFSCCPFCH